MIDRTKWSGLFPNLHLELHFKLHVVQDYDKHNSEKFDFSDMFGVGNDKVKCFFDNNKTCWSNFAKSWGQREADNIVMMSSLT